MVVVQIFTFVLTTALLRHSERTIFPALPPRFGGPTLALGDKPGSPLSRLHVQSNKLISSDTRSRPTAFPAGPTTQHF